MTIRGSARTFARAVLPENILHMWRRRRLLHQAHHLARQAAALSDPFELWDALAQYPAFLPLQRRVEIASLLARLRPLQVQRVCEIGTASGGTTFLLARAAAPGAVIVTMDLKTRPGQAESLGILGGPDRRLLAFVGDSRDDGMQARVRAAMDGAPLDLLFIDGDHRYESVRADFRRYRPLVRASGLIAFHDIVPDAHSRAGAHTPGDTGGVPRFWSELARIHAGDTEVFVEDPNQDGCGIGVLHVKAST